VNTRIDLAADAGIQEVFRHLSNDQARTGVIAGEVRQAFEQGRKVLVLTERTEHLHALQAAIDDLQPAPVFDTFLDAAALPGDGSGGTMHGRSAPGWGEFGNSTPSRPAYPTDF
jgi:hypothetical protein